LTWLNPEDMSRLSDQRWQVLRLMLDGEWRTLSEISKTTGYPEPSVSARLRDLRKEEFGAFTVDKRIRHSPGLWEYKVVGHE